LLEKLKSDDRWRHLPVVMLTARAELQDKLKALRIGVDDYLLKPFEEEELLIRLNNLIANHKLRQHQKEEEVFQTDATPPFSKADAKWLEKVELSVQSAIDNPQFTLLQLSQMLFISERQMSRKIKTLTGLTPNKYIREIKLQHARTLLESRKYVTVSEVSQAVGFSKTEYFSQLYKERFGKLPSAYLV
jgi:YesN/AraC family two-component response regulator